VHYKKIIALFFFLATLWAQEPLIERAAPLRLSVSLVIPCVPKHFPYIPELLKRYAEQTVQPDEVVISLSQAFFLDPNEIKAVKNEPWPFQLKILEHPDKRSEGENRNLGTLYSTGDLILYQDADDLPHPQRVEWIKYLFEHYQIDHLIHGYVLERNFHGFSHYDIDSRGAYYSQKLTNCVGDCHFHNGATALTRAVANQVKWVEGFVISTDTLSNEAVYRSIEHKVFLLKPLILYRDTLSTYHGNNR
jgi:glycosyltransferase involved in cell wall biosynthesis